MKWLIGMLLLLLAALILDSGLLAYAAYVLLGLLLLNRYLAYHWINNLRVTRICRLATKDEEGLGESSTDVTAEVGDRLIIELTLHNTGWLPIPWVLLEDLLPREALDRRYPRLEMKGSRLQLAMLRGRGKHVVRYRLVCRQRGYFPIGPVLVENGDLFGLHRRFRLLTDPCYLLIYPRLVPLEGYDLTSRRPIGDIRMSHRLYEDPTRIAGVRRYEAGDPLNRVHWKATARTGQLHSKVYEPSTLAGATILLDFHQAGYDARGEPMRSDLVITTTLALANAVAEMGQQIGLISNARDSADRLRQEKITFDPATRRTARLAQMMADQNTRLQPLLVPTRRGPEQFPRIRELLARVEFTDGLPVADLVFEMTGRMPRDATVVAVLPHVPIPTALALGALRRQGFAVTIVLVMVREQALEDAYARLHAEGLRDIRHLVNEAMLPELCRQHLRPGAYELA